MNVELTFVLNISHRCKGFGMSLGSRSSSTRFRRRIFLRFPKTLLIGTSDGPLSPKSKCFHDVAYHNSSCVVSLGVVGILFSCRRICTLTSLAFVWLRHALFARKPLNWNRTGAL